jgi:hypothetical protein
MSVRMTFALGIKLPGRETDDPPPSSAEVEIAWSLYRHFSIHLHGEFLN